MNITVTINKEFGGNGSLRAVCSAAFDDEYVLHGIEVYDGMAGLFVVMPSVKHGGLRHEIFHALNNQSRRQLISAVLSAYENRAVGMVSPNPSAKT